jgi:alpha-tubulin suppressor-like RCC1 family protein
VPAAAIAAGLGHTCALTRAEGVKCWGYNGHDELGTGNKDLPQSPTPLDVSGLASGVTAIAAGIRHSCALTSAGGVKCWGYGRGPLGDGTTERRAAPVEVSGLGSGVAAVAAGNDASCAVTVSGGVKCWGINTGGQLGDGTTVDRLTPIDVVGLGSGVKAVASGAGYNRTCALTTAGGVKCWGRGNLTPVDVPGLANGVTAITSSCALTSAGGVKCWGRDDLTPADVSGLSSGVAAITSGFHSCALMATGIVKCWGFNDHGQLGDGTTYDSAIPVDVKGLHGRVTAITAGSFNTCALLGTGAVDCWGANSGTLPDGTTVDRLHPVSVVGLGTAKATLTIVPRSVGVTPGRVAPITLRCGSAAACKGKLTLSAGRQTLGSRAVSLRAGTTVVFAVELTPRAFELLHRVRRLQAQAVVSGTAATKRTITLVAP